MTWLLLTVGVGAFLVWAICRTAGDLDRWEQEQLGDWERHRQALESLDIYREEPDEELQAILDMLEDYLARRREAEQPELRVVR